MCGTVGHTPWDGAMTKRRPPVRRTTLNVSLPARQRKLVDQVVCDGEYASASEVVRGSLRVWETERARRNAAIDALRREIQVGLEQADRGEAVDGDAALDVIDRELFGAPGGVRAAR